MSTRRWLEKYSFEDQYKIFLILSHVDLYAWITRLNKRKHIFKGGKHKEWTPKLIQ